MRLGSIVLSRPFPHNRARWLARIVRQWWRTLAQLRVRPPRRLRLCESLSLGERRFVAVVEFDRARFLVGGTAGSLVLLSRLADEGPLQASEPVNRAGEEEF